MRKLWLAFTAVVVLSFAVLGWTGFRIYQQAPPVPTRVVTTDGRQLIGPGEIYGGQNVWQSIGGMEVGSVWGHGSYVAPDWTADWLHREAMFILDRWSGSADGYDALAGGATGRASEPAATAHADEHLRRRTGDAHGRPRASRGLRGQRRALHRRVHATDATSTPFRRAR